MKLKETSEDLIILRNKIGIMNSNMSELYRLLNIIDITKLTPQEAEMFNKKEVKKYLDEIDHLLTKCLMSI